MSPKVFIIVLHYQNWEDTNECLESLKKINYDNFEIIVIDNDKDNRGFAGGNNAGIKQALEKGADYVLLLNNDTVVEPDFLRKLIEVGEREERIGILGPVIYEYGSDKIHFAGGKVNWLYTKGIHVTHNMKHITKETDYITGACMLIKRKVIEKIGLMDEDYFLYCEDVDLCLRAQKAGFLCGVASDSRISHKVSKNAKIASFSYIYYHTRNGLLLAKRNAPVFIKILAYLNSFLVYGKQIIKLAIFPQKRLWARAIMKGIGDFYRGKLGKLT
ncbi:MAG: glycosyltransferase family 2 protein [Candidatus Portnoybacteria bacterium CG10_big_fil_rev_8_21_14_0_10_38_18]|uniref:Glycosyltransferase family 2 protein n=1 Tax=Candidatus Portnoybacteria bacterium CG10_big_fil_rev_8_21_14_0_10_38_18 TaxID=1974813 RepID=A0A2M8KCL4_9BACT|nr:MAG: glycosyltransferase family 2 protein [Candidatus Portnoybacteria bacterium CG10_big_fil_rev_8_21_14_0_10_38_18]